MSFTHNINPHAYRHQEIAATWRNKSAMPSQIKR